MKKMLKWIALAFASMLMCVAFVACVPSNLEKAESKLAKEGYNVEVVTDLGEDKCQGAIRAMKSDGEETDVLMAWLFDSAGDAKDYYNKYKDQLNDMASEGGSIYSSPILKGKWIYIGTSDAIEDFED